MKTNENKANIDETAMKNDGKPMNIGSFDPTVRANRSEGPARRPQPPYVPQLGLHLHGKCDVEHILS